MCSVRFLSWHLSNYELPPEERVDSLDHLIRLLQQPNTTSAVRQKRENPRSVGGAQAGEKGNFT